MNQKLFILGNGVDWCRKSLYGLIKREDIYLLNEKLPVNGTMKKRLARLFFSDTLNRKIKLPFKKLFYNQVILEIKQFSNNDDVNILIFDHNKFGGNISFIKKLRKQKKVKNIIYIFTNIAKFTAAYEYGYIDDLNDWYDVVFAFDLEDAKKYNFSYSPLIYDADESYNKQLKESKDDLVFYVGQAKDRLSGLLSCFEKLKKLGIKTDFHIANVSENDIKYADEITYNKFMTYDQAVDSIQKATCLIDVIQGDSTGLTIKTCEAVCYDKKLITTNVHVKEYPFYDPRYIRVIESEDDIDEAFFKENTDVHYSEEGKKYFSAESFLQRIDKALERRG